MNLAGLCPAKEERVKVKGVLKNSLYTCEADVAIVTALRGSDLDWDMGIEEGKWEEDTGFHCNLRCYLIEYTDVQSSIIHNSQKVETSQVSIHG